MIHAAALFSSLVSLGLISAIYACTVLSPQGSWLRTEWFTSILLSLLTGLFPLGLAASLTGLWGALAGGLALGAAPGAIADLVSLAAVVATVAVFRATLKANAAPREAPDNVSPLSPRPAGPPHAAGTVKKAA